MKIITKKRAYKFIGMQLALLIALVVTQMGMQYASSYTWVGFEKKDSSWKGIADTAQAANSLCSIQLDEANKQLRELRDVKDLE